MIHNSNNADVKYIKRLNHLTQDLNDFTISYQEYLDYIYIMLTEVRTDIELSETDKLFLKVKIHKTAAEVL